VAKRKCNARFYVQPKKGRMLIPIKNKTAAKKIAGVQAVEKAHTAACKKGEGQAKCKKTGPCQKVFASKL
jgi:hypothetical protein